jgi:hypothetical protein
MTDRNQFAGFWRCFVALNIDLNLVVLVLFSFILLGALLPPPERVSVEAPDGLFTVETVLEIFQ